MYKEILERLAQGEELTAAKYLELIVHRDELRERAAELAREKRAMYYGQKVYIRGLIEFTNICRNDCFYCGLRRCNSNCERYRLTPEEIADCADQGYTLGFRTFVLQGGEDPYYTDEILCKVIRSIKRSHPDCAVTLSVGERSDESYSLLREAGADRYLLRHETSNKTHYEKLHPSEMSFDDRMRCIRALKALGYQVGIGFMVGSPYQTIADLASEMVFIREMKPHMVGIGPFIPHKDTPFKAEPAGTSEMTTFLLSLIRLTLPNVLLPATTALGTVDPRGREKGIIAGANVVMPNLSPAGVRKKYLLYDNKICTGDEAAQCIECLKQRIKTTGCEIVTDRGDFAERR